MSLVVATLGEGNDYPTDKCSAGYYCPGGQDMATPQDLLCPAGHFCTVGTTVPELCGNGTYQQQHGQDHCDICPEGYYCNALDGEYMTLSLTYR